MKTKSAIGIFSVLLATAVSFGQLSRLPPRGGAAGAEPNGLTLRKVPSPRTPHYFSQHPFFQKFATSLLDNPARQRDKVAKGQRDKVALCLCASVPLCLCASGNVGLNLSEIPFKIVHETYHRTNGRENWELHLINADGSNPVNLTNTPDVDEMYPHVSPDGTKICFVADEGTRRSKIRSVYYMNIDGTERVKVAEDARQPCWGPESKSIAYLRQEYERYSTREYATSGLFIYDLRTREHREHPNKSLQHIYATCWSPDGNWFLAAVHGGMEYSDAILAFQANGARVFDLGQWGVKGCRPDLSPPDVRRNGTKMVWGETDWNLCIGDINLGSSEPRVANIHDVVRCRRKFKVYHVDISPDSKYIAFSYGPFEGGQQVGGKARGWNICVGDLTGKWVQITTDGNHNKEPDWVHELSIDY